MVSGDSSGASGVGGTEAGGTSSNARKMQPVSELLARLRGVSKDEITRMNAIPNAMKRARKTHHKTLHLPVSCVSDVCEYAGMCGSKCLLNDTLKKGLK